MGLFWSVFRDKRVFFFIGEIAAFFYASATGRRSLVLATILSNWRDSPLLSNRWKRAVSTLSAFLAHTSYSTYLAHLVIFQLVYNFSMGFAANLVLFITAIIVSFYVIEKPFLDMRLNYTPRGINKGNNMKMESAFRTRPNKSGNECDCGD